MHGSHKSAAWKTEERPYHTQRLCRGVKSCPAEKTHGRSCRRDTSWSPGSVVVPWRPRTFAVAWVHLLTLGTKFAEEKNICYAVTFGPFHCGRDYKQKDAWNVYDAMWLPCGSHLNTQFHFLLHLLALAPTCPCCRQASFYVALRFRSGFRIYKSD